ncbi:MAG TPA: hypothetical protein VL172_02865 [Kofleriaceae bacterium]|nr:hypothetical protein [Kofleriaceae bacterium]
MGLFVRAVVWGFGFSVGVALYKRLNDQLGLDKPAGSREPQRDAPPPAPAGNGGSTADAHA